MEIMGISIGCREIHQRFMQVDVLASEAERVKEKPRGKATPFCTSRQCIGGRLQSYEEKLVAQTDGFCNHCGHAVVWRRV